MGSKKAAWNPMPSTKAPTAGGMNAPPTIAVHSSPDPWGLPSPRSSMAKVKIVGNMMLLKNPTPSNKSNAAPPDAAIDAPINPAAHTAAKASNRKGDTLPINPEPANRPTMAPPQ